MSIRYHRLGPLLSGEGSRASLALAIPRDGGPPEPRVLIPLHEDVVQEPDAFEAVRRETRRAEQLEHPNLVRVFGLEDGPDGPARVVEFADAESLRRVLEASQTLPPRLAARIAIDAATGVHYAHLAGNDDGTPLVHGDLRPETLLVTYAGATKVGGYGALAAAPREPGGRRVRGRRQHCAPEQVVGGRDAVDVRTDVYLLGVLLFELLSGKVPYSDLPPNEFDHAVLTHPPPPLPVAERPVGLEAVLRRAMAKKAFDRYASPLALREAIEKAMEGAIASHEEVAQYLDELFPDAPNSPRSTRKKLIADAIQQQREQAAAAAAATAAAAAALASAAATAAAPPPPVPAGADSQAVAAGRPAASPPPRRNFGAWLVATVALMLAGAAVFWLWSAGYFGGVLPPLEVAPSVVDEHVDAGVASIDAGVTATAPDQDAGEALATLTLFVDPPVDVAVSGISYGRTPARIPLSPGKHVLRLTDRRNLINVTRSVQVPPDGKTERIYLGRGYVNVSAPEGAEVFIDGRDYGKAPLREIGLYEGPHRIVVTLANLRWEEAFTLAPNERVRFDVDLQ